MASGASLSRWLRVPDMVTVDVAVGYAALRPGASAYSCMLDQLAAAVKLIVVASWCVTCLLTAAVRQTERRRREHVQCPCTLIALHSEERDSGHNYLASEVHTRTKCVAHWWCGHDVKPDGSCARTLCTSVCLPCGMCYLYTLQGNVWARA